MTDMYLGPTQTTMMELFLQKIVRHRNIKKALSPFYHKKYF